MNWGGNANWLRRGGAALAVGAGLFLAVSLIGYDPNDPPGRVAEPPSVRVMNPCGPVGAWLAAAVMQSVGEGILVPLVLIPALWWAHRTGRLAGSRAKAAVGVAVLVLVGSWIFQRWLPTPLAVAPVGGGGYLGAALGTGLEQTVGLVGSLLIVAALAAVGLGLLGEWLWREPALAVIDWGRRLPWPHRRQPAAALDPEPIGHQPALPAPSATPTRPTRVPSSVGLPEPVLPDEDGPAPAPPRPQPTASNRVVATPAPAQPRRPATPTTTMPARMSTEFALPPLELLDPPSAFSIEDHEARIHERAGLVERTLLDFGYNVRVVQINTGPVITQFEIELEAGLRVSRVMGLADDLAIALAVPSVRIVAPIPGKTTVGVEVPNDRRTIVRLGEVVQGVQASIGKWRVPLFLGKDVKGNPLAFDLSRMPHLLIAGRTGTGKSVCLNAMIMSILMLRRPDDVKLLLIDPKSVEMTQYKRIPHLMHPVVTDMKKAEALLAWACEKMDERYALLARAGVRNIQDFNALPREELVARLAPEDEEEQARVPERMPSIVIVVDEFADLICVAPKEVETHVVRLAQKSRAVGMHLILATQKPTVDVITGLIKGNLPARIAFQVQSRNDSRVVLDEMGAHRLLGDGDMLFLIPGTSHIVRAQGTYVSDEEVTRICSYLERFPQEFSKEVMQAQLGGVGAKDRAAALKERDDLYEAAIEVIIREGRGSCSLLQRALGIGYGRASRLIDFMSEDGIVGEYKVGGPREVLISLEDWEALKNGGAAPDDKAA